MSAADDAFRAEMHAERLNRVRPMKIRPNHDYPDLLDFVLDTSPNTSTSVMLNERELAELVHKALRWLREHPAPVEVVSENPKGVN